MAWVEPRGTGFVGRFRDEANDKAVTRRYRTKRAALQAAEEAEAKIRNGEWFDPKAGAITLSSYFATWLPERQVELTTRKGYETHFRVGIEPHLGHLELKAITPTLVQRWVTVQADNEDGPRTIEARYKLLSQILGGKKGASAMRDRLIPANPCIGVELPPKSAREVDVYDFEEYLALAAAIPEEHKALVAMASDSAMRWGELMGQGLADLSEAYSLATVRRTIVETSRADNGGLTQFRWKDRPKGGKPRRLALTPEMSAMLATHVDRLGLGPGDRLFSVLDDDGQVVRTEEWPEGLPISRRHFRDFIWLPAHEASGVRPRRFHDLRGSNLTWLLAAGADIKVVQERAGHKSIETTQVYLAPLQTDKTALDALARTRAAATPRPPVQAAPEPAAGALSADVLAQALELLEAKKAAKKKSKKAKKLRPDLTVIQGG